LKKKYLKKLLQENERSHSWLSRKLGVSHTTVINWTKGIHPIDKENFIKILNVFNIPLEKLLKDI
tara:strand:+ start:351 stop:545 length:195 start_codon:yes stop_codon:yes gene_type:complete